MRAAILCPGPSLKKTMPTLWDVYSRVIAVTDAIFADAPFTHFCMTENPRSKTVLAYRDVLREKKPVCWGLGLNAIPLRWKTLMKVGDVCQVLTEDLNVLLDAFPYETTVPRPPEKGGHYRWSRTPKFYAIARLISDGYEEIDIYGSDMRGSHNFHPITGAKLGALPKVPEKRWTAERSHLADIREEAAEHGVTIRHVLPPVDDDLRRTIYGEGDSKRHTEGAGGGDQSGDLDPSSSAGEHLGGVGPPGSPIRSGVRQVHLPTPPGMAGS